MYKEKSFIAIIPARAGSKGLTNKNIRKLDGKPLIAWSIETAQGCKYIDEIMVTTDSEEYAAIARDYGANVPFIRPEKYATDEASRSEVIANVINFYKENGHEFDYIILLEPTSPLRSKDDLNCAIEKLINNKSGAESIVSVCKLEGLHPEFVIKLENDFLKFLDPNQQSKVLRRQDLETFYFYEGSLYISTVDAYLEKEFYHSKTLGYVVPRWKSIEIDEIEDLVMAEAIIKYKNIKT